MNDVFSWVFPKCSFAKILMCFGVTLLFLLLLPHGIPLFPSGFMAAPGFFTFYLMMHEDYYENTIDLLLCGFLVLSFALASDRIFEFFMIYFLSLGVIQCLHALTAHRIENEAIIKDPDFLPTETEEKSYGWLPSFGGALLLFLFLTRFVDTSSLPILADASQGFDDLLHFLKPHRTILFLPWVLLSLGWWYSLNQKIRKEEVQDNISHTYGFGDGDGYVLAAFLAFLGMKIFLVALFLNMLVLLLYGLPVHLAGWWKSRKCL